MLYDMAACYSLLLVLRPPLVAGDARPARLHRKSTEQQRLRVRSPGGTVPPKTSTMAYYVSPSGSAGPRTSTLAAGRAASCARTA